MTASLFPSTAFPGNPVSVPSCSIKLSVCEAVPSLATFITLSVGAGERMLFILDL